MLTYLVKGPGHVPEEGEVSQVMKVKLSGLKEMTVGSRDVVGVGEVRRVVHQGRGHPPCIEKKQLRQVLVQGREMSLCQDPVDYLT
jgi:hypothetical protein